MKKIKKIVLIEPKEIKTSVFSFWIIPNTSLLILSSILKKHGFTVNVVLEKLSGIPWNLIKEADLVGLTLMSCKASHGYKIADKIRKINPNTKILMGGYHPTFNAEESLNHCDIVVKGDGENTILEIIKTYDNNEDFLKIKGISYKNNNEIIDTGKNTSAFNTHIPCDYSSIYQLKEYCKNPLNRRKVIPTIYTSKGCPFDCNFCSIRAMLGKGYVNRDPNEVIEDIKNAYKLTKSNFFFIVDDNFALNIKKTKILLKKIIELNLPIMFSTQIRIESAKDNELLYLMKKAGIVWLAIGLESINEETLNQYNKGQSLQDIEKGIKNISSFGIFLHGMFVFGTDHDKPGDVLKTVDFAIKNNLSSLQLFSIIPFKGTEIYNSLNKNRHILNKNPDYYDGQYVTTLPKHYKPSILQKEIIEGYNKFYSKKQNIKKILSRFLKGILDRRLFLHIPYAISFNKSKKHLYSYLEYLTEKENNLYDENNTLIEQKLER
jgi:anaerobic magnesium-protoporphyrin IX monomethyl ester cyclase